MKNRAAEQIMQDLINCLLAEGFFGELSLHTLNEWQKRHHNSPFNVLSSSANSLVKEGINHEVEDEKNEYRVWEWLYDPLEQRSLVVLLQPGITQQWERVANSSVFECQDALCTSLYMQDAPMRFLEKSLVGVAPRYVGNEKGMLLFKEVLAISQHQTELSYEHGIESHNLLDKNKADFFLAMEQWASLRDRPYHPLAKAKQGLTDDEYRAYQAEFNRPISLNWVAVRKDWIQTGDGVSFLEADAGKQRLDQFLLPTIELEKLAMELKSKGISLSHIALPVHPWQFEHVLATHIEQELENGDCQRLSYVSPDFYATSSLRSMTPCFDSPDHLKLPMAVYSLGASRYLPAVKMINGGYSEALLKKVKTLDPVLQSTLYLCDESKWWAYMPPNATLFDEAPRHLSAMIRTYPSTLLSNKSLVDTRLMPMAALGTPLPDSDDHFFSEWMAYRQLERHPDSVMTLFSELCSCFFGINLRMFKLGMLAEVHGQNAVLVWQDGKAHGILLRDHDSLRIYVPWLEENGMQDPEYCIKPGHANTLYHDSSDALLFWLQTLGVQVNMRSIIETLPIVYHMSEANFWEVMQAEILTQISLINFSNSAKEMLLNTLFEKETWPQKHLLSPMIDRAGGPGSMPFGKGDVVNPFKQCH